MLSRYGVPQSCLALLELINFTLQDVSTGAGDICGQRLTFFYELAYIERPACKACSALHILSMGVWDCRIATTDSQPIVNLGDGSRALITEKGCLRMPASYASHMLDVDPMRRRGGRASLVVGSGVHREE
jgi:hypothetical protein